MRQRRRALVLAAAISVVAAAPAFVPPTLADGIGSAAALVVSQGEARESAGDELTALKRYSDALAIDPSFEDAYLALGTLRAKRGELVEADQVFSTGLLHRPTSAALLLGRAKV